MAEDLKINQKIDIVVEKGPYTGTYLSKVADINGDIYQVTALFVGKLYLYILIKQ